MIEAGNTPVHAVPPAPGEMVTVIVAGTAVAVANTDGVLRAFDDTCTHRECPLSEGRLDGLTVVCPCHMSRFDLLSGEPLNGPAQLPIRIRQVQQDGDNLIIER
ncbi:MAG: Rieske 2Fe-2S domain-containing protein [Chloroflexota bacterium]